MRIDGITTCVGPLYAEYLRRTLPVWLDTLDSLTVATASVDRGTNALLMESPNNGKLGIVPTYAFTDRGAHFNKGAGLNVAYTAAKPTDWILSLDCDVEPPANWREIAEPRLEVGCLHGCTRTPGRAGIVPSGFFQLWHTSDTHPPTPPFAECYGHAGRYDMVFLGNWLQPNWRMLPFTVTHHGEPGKDWFGVGNEHLVRELMREGVAVYRERDERLPAL